MIIDKLSDLRRYIPSLPALETVCSVLESGILKTQSFGSYKTDNPSVRYNLFTYHTEKTASDIYEIHQKEVDVQILLSGFERMDIASKDGLQTIEEYNPAKDALFSKGNKAVSYHADTTTFALFFPGEPHAPNLVDGKPTEVVKVVFKILVS
ncbi:MAG: DUF386 family protein [Spirochaetales bacterium]|jgi:biofilm protein TabA|nr:DUF386 family protein [Spirochaetales bacterium]